jgi:hypothetical protein
MLKRATAENMKKGKLKTTAVNIVAWAANHTFQ